MRFFKYLSISLICLVSSSLFARSANSNYTQATDLLDTVNQKDLWAVRDWLKTKRVALNAKSGDLSIAGDVTAEWRNVHEKLGSLDLTSGSNSPGGWSNNLYSIDFRLYFDYKADRSWASVKLEFNNAGGTFNGEANQIALDRANMGYHLFDDGDQRLDVLVGRQRSYEMYDSEVQFNSTLDGFTATYAMAMLGLADLSIRGGGYIVDQSENHPVWIIQSGFYDILDSGLYFEYAFCDWHKEDRKTTTITNSTSNAVVTVGKSKWDFITNQFILGYIFNPEVFSIDVRLFGGILWNAHAAKREIQRLSQNKLKSSEKNLAGWVALQLGSVERAGDWAFQAQWQVVEALSIPDWDVSGIGTGNSTSSSLFGFNKFSSATNFPGNGNSNYNGFELDLLYSVTNELVLEIRLQRALAEEKQIGYPLNYTNFILAAIYGF
ncbi:MAG: hypothetical protein S4CHLAM7_10830 [Chlamydiae bacterium]|nr:hypothetical protein [Chlamydiota bacterium]